MINGISNQIAIAKQPLRLALDKQLNSFQRF